MVTDIAKTTLIIEAMALFLEAAAGIQKVKALVPIENQLRKDMQRIFGKQERIFLKQLERYRSRFEEAISTDELNRIMAVIAVGTDGEMNAAIQGAGGKAMEAAAGHRIGEAGLDIAFDLKNPRAVSFLKKNAALSVTEINKTTKARMRTILTQATDEGWSYNRTAKEIKDRWEEFRIGKPQLHIQSRAHLVAVTESANAYETGNALVVDQMTAIGLDMEKSWQDVGDDRVSDGCRENAAEGWIASNQAHASGHMHPPRFPGCRCDELYRRRKQ